MPAAVHWDDVEGARRTVGHLDGTWFDLGSAAGSREVGVQRIRVEPGAWSTPAHVEHGEEEIFYVLGGSGVSWQDPDPVRRRRSRSAPVTASSTSQTGSCTR